MLPEHEEKFGKAPVLAKTSDGRLHVLDGHHTLFYHLRDGGGALNAFVFKIATPDFRDGKLLRPLMPLFEGGELARRLADAVRARKFDPDQPRDEEGKWTSGGGNGGG